MKSLSPNATPSHAALSFLLISMRGTSVSWAHERWVHLDWLGIFRFLQSDRNRVVHCLTPMSEFLYHKALIVSQLKTNAERAILKKEAI